MKRVQLIHLKIFRKIATAGIVSGIILFLVSFFIENSFYHSLTFFLGIYTLEASMVLFGFGLFLTIIEELTNRQQKL